MFFCFPFLSLRAGQSGGSKNLRVVWTLQLRADK
jgi:hypothetical protein